MQRHSQNQTKTRVFLLGGTTEAREIADALASDPRFDATLSLAGRTRNPATSSLVTRMGGFGGVEGLAAYISDHAVDVVVDATHPFAAQISANAIAACARQSCPLISFERPPWSATPADNWIRCASVAAAIAALPQEQRVVFSGLGRLSLAELASGPQHHYVIRVIDLPDAPIPVPHVTLIEGRGPFKTADDIALFTLHRIDIVLAKNAGGKAAVSKIEAARQLSLPVMMIDRPFIPERPTVATVGEVMVALGRHVVPRIDRGV